MRHAEDLFLHFIAVRPGRAAKIIGGSGDVRNQGTDEAACTRFSGTDAKAQAAHFPAQDVGHRFVVEADDLSFQRRQEGCCFVFPIGPCRQADFDEARTGVHGQGRIRLVHDEVHQFFFNEGFAHIVNLDIA